MVPATLTYVLNNPIVLGKYVPTWSVITEPITIGLRDDPIPIHVYPRPWIKALYGPPKSTGRTLKPEKYRNQIKPFHFSTCMKW